MCGIVGYIGSAVYKDVEHVVGRPGDRRPIDVNVLLLTEWQHGRAVDRRVRATRGLEDAELISGAGRPYKEPLKESRGSSITQVRKVITRSGGGTNRNIQGRVDDVSDRVRDFTVRQRQGVLRPSPLRPGC